MEGCDLNSLESITELFPLIILIAVTSQSKSSANRFTLAEDGRLRSPCPRL